MIPDIQVKVECKINENFSAEEFIKKTLELAEYIEKQKEENPFWFWIG